MSSPTISADSAYSALRAAERLGSFDAARAELGSYDVTIAGRPSEQAVFEEELTTADAIGELNELHDSWISEIDSELGSHGNISARFGWALLVITAFFTAMVEDDALIEELADDPAAQAALLQDWFIEAIGGRFAEDAAEWIADPEARRLFTERVGA